jgi:hypothetical protein
LYRFLLIFISILPLALIYYIYIGIYWWTFSAYVISIFNFIFLEDVFIKIYILLLWLFDINFWNIIYTLSIIISIISFYFYYILLIRLNNSYLKWEKLAFLKNEYLNFKLFLKYFLLTLLFFLILLIPVILIIVVLSIVIISLWWTEAVILLTTSWPINFFTIFSLISFIILVLVLFYIFYRFIFSYFILVESGINNKKWVLVLLKESFIRTKWFEKLFNFIKVFFIILILYLPIYSIDKSLSEIYTDLSRYAEYISLEGQDRADLKSYDSYYYEGLELIYSWKELGEINALQDKYSLITTFFWIFKFLLINWVFLMAFSSFYFSRIRE